MYNRKMNLQLVVCISDFDNSGRLCQHKNGLYVSYRVNVLNIFRAEACSCSPYQHERHSLCLTRNHGNQVRNEEDRVSGNIRYF
jgi:hypothetical protein